MKHEREIASLRSRAAENILRAAAPALLAALAVGCGKDYAPMGPEVAKQTPAAEPAPRTPEPTAGSQSPPRPSPTPQPRNSADIKARMELPDYKVSPGDKLTVPVQMMDADGAVAAGVDFYLSYPKEMLEAQSVIGTQTTAGFQISSNLSTPGRVSVVATNTAGGAFLTKDAHLFDILFIVKADAPLDVEGMLKFVRADIAQSGRELFRADRADQGLIIVTAKTGAATAATVAPVAPAAPAGAPAP